MVDEKRKMGRKSEREDEIKNGIKKGTRQKREGELKSNDEKRQVMYV